MSTARTRYVCADCGGQTTQWQGQCPACGAWNSLSETAFSRREAKGAAGGRDRAAAPATVLRLDAVEVRPGIRLATGFDELDRVLGGGLTAGSVVLIGGDPGIGKSTLLIQAMARLGANHPVLYATGEESAEQVALRAQRLSLESAGVLLIAENQVETILATAMHTQPRVIVVDSIQTVYTDTLASAPGSVSQVRESAALCTRYARKQGAALFLVGHVTKDGSLAGPRVLEHMVDTVLYFEGDPGSSYRVIRAFKNRFGAINEIGVFAMTETGLKEVNNPSAIFLSRPSEPASGSVVVVTLEGTRPLLVEVQALVDEAHAPNPRRVCVGLDATRLAMLLAVAHRHAGIVLFDQDVFVNAVGGLRLNEPAADLAVLLAAISSLRNRPLMHKLAVFGEVGLSGEIRPVQRGQDRLREVEKLGFERVILPAANLPRRYDGRIEVIPVKTVAEAVEKAFED